MRATTSINLFAKHSDTLTHNVCRMIKMTFLFQTALTFIKCNKFSWNYTNNNYFPHYLFLIFFCVKWFQIPWTSAGDNYIWLMQRFSIVNCLCLRCSLRVCGFEFPFPHVLFIYFSCLEIQVNDAVGIWVHRKHIRMFCLMCVV